MAALIREAIEEKTGNSRPRPRSLGVAASEYTDTGSLSGEVRPEPRTWR